MEKNIYFFRHAQADKSIESNINRPITNVGISQAKELAEFMKDKPIDFIISSPYKRALDTVAFVAEYFPHLKINTDQDLSELHFLPNKDKMDVKIKLTNMLKKISELPFDNIIVSAHSGTIRIMFLIMGIEKDKLKNCELHHIKYKDGNFNFISKWNAGSI